VKQQTKINAYIELLKEQNQKSNLYSAKAYDRLQYHIKDSSNIAEIIGNKPATVFDLGSGSGLPSIIIAILNPLNHIFAVESRAKKASFLELAQKHLSLENFCAINKSAQEFIRNTEIKPDFFTAKAFAPYPKIFAMTNKQKMKPCKIIIPISKLQKDNIDKMHDLLRESDLFASIEKLELLSRYALNIKTIIKREKKNK